MSKLRVTISYTDGSLIETATFPLAVSEIAAIHAIEEACDKIAAEEVDWQ